MKAESGIPFIAWVGTAVLAHLMWTAGAERVARVVEDVTQVRWFAESVQSEFAQGDSIEVTLEDLPPELSEPEESEEPEEAELEEAEEPEVKPDPAKPEPAKPEETPPKPEERKPDKPIQLFPVPKAVEEKPKPPPIEQPKMDQRIAVEQHVEDENQEDNPNARFVGDQANHVEEETVARITSHDQNDPNPTPGGQHTGPSQEPGNADETVIGESEDREGDPDEAPGEHVVEEKPGDENRPPEPPKPEPPKAGKPEAPRVAHAEQPQPPPQPRSEPQPPSTNGPNPLTADKGAYSLDPTRKKKPRPVASARPLRVNPGPMGLGARANENGVRTSLDIHDVVSTVGHDELARQRAADGERRRSKHRGSWNTSSFERWRGAIENYVSSVRAGNQTALNTARVPFATYLVRVHNRIHPVFADTFLVSLDSLPFDHPANDYKLFAVLEIVLEPNQGRIVKMGVIKTSGVTSFDVGALDSVNRAGPFGKAPSAIISTDGNVYLHWQFHRNPIYACSTMNARPYMLNRPPPIEEPKQPPREPKPPSDPRERGVPPAGPPGGDDNRSRYGLWEPLRRRHRG